MVVKIYRLRSGQMTNRTVATIVVTLQGEGGVTEYPFHGWPSFIDRLEEDGPSVLNPYGSCNFGCEGNEHYHLIKKLEI